MTLTRRAALVGGGAVLAAGFIGGRAGAVPPVVAWGNINFELDPHSQMAQGGWARIKLANPAAIASLKAGSVDIIPDSDGHFLVGFDRDAAKTVWVTGACASSKLCTDDGKHPEIGLTIAPGAWAIEQIDAPFHPPAMADETFERIRKDEMARIDAARSHDTGAAGWRQQFVWPVKGRISGKFGAQRVYRGTPGSYHSGVDIATGASGTPYTAPADGVVVLAATPANGGPFTLEGNLLMIDHGMGLSSAFLHSETLLVGEGDRVTQGQPLGHIGMTGRATGPHLHWSLRWHEARLDPALMAGGLAGGLG